MDNNIEKVNIRKFCIKDYKKLIELWINTGLRFKPKGRDNHVKIQNELDKGNSHFVIISRKPFKHLINIC